LIELEIGEAKQDRRIGAERQCSTTSFFGAQRCEPLAVVLERTAAPVGCHEDVDAGAGGDHPGERAPGEELGVIGVGSQREHNRGHTGLPWDYGERAADGSAG
jgi:hypothetical protein